MSLRQVSGAVTAEYELEHLLLEGHCFDLSTGQPPRGLQFTLGMSQDPLMHDTIVMANLVSSFFLSQICSRVLLFPTWCLDSWVKITCFYHGRGISS